jgi:hypothetical protein
VARQKSVIASQGVQGCVDHPPVIDTLFSAYVRGLMELTVPATVRASYGFER